MRARRVLQKCLSESLGRMHAARSRVLLHAVEALVAGRRPTLMDVARSWPGAERVRAPLKAFDRLLGNTHLQAEREQVYGDMARWLLMETVRNAPWVCRVLLYRKAPKGRKHRTRAGKIARSKKSLEAAAREREPWLIVASPSLVTLSPRHLVPLYARRMRIELSFRDLKSHRYGQGFEDSLMRGGKRIGILLLINALAAFASWLGGLACEATGVDRWLSSICSTRRLYSILRIGREALVRAWPMERTSQWLECLRALLPSVLDQMRIPA